MKRSGSWFGWVALTIGVATVAASFLVTSTTPGASLTLGFGALTAYFGALAVLVRNPTPDHWSLVVVGLAMFILPWLGAGFAPDRGAAWTAWVAGFLILVLGLVAWRHDNPPTETGVNEYGAAPQKIPGAWVGRSALVVGLVTVICAAAAHSLSTGVIVTVGLGALTMMMAVWSLLAADPTHDHLKIATTGILLFIAPWMVGFAGEDVAWTAWVAGFIVTALGTAGYLRGDALDHGRHVHEDAASSYRQRYPHGEPGHPGDQG